MNKRIIQIAKELGFDLKAAKSSPYGHILPNSLSCFAKGIIRDAVANLRAHGYDDAAVLLAKHFEVE